MIAVYSRETKEFLTLISREELDEWIGMDESKREIPLTNFVLVFNTCQAGGCL